MFRPTPYSTRFSLLAGPALVLLAACGGGGSSPAPNPIQAPAGLSYAANPAVYILGTPITPDVPASSGGTVVSYSIAPAPPSGLSLNTSTGILAGTPTSLAPQASYTVTATNGGGTTQASLTLTVMDHAPAFTYGSVPTAFGKGLAITTLTPASTGGTVVSWAVAPALPGGLTLNTATGVISGAPAVAAPSAAYTVTATNSGGTLGLALTFEVVDAAPAITTFQASPAATLYGGSSNLSWALGTGTNDASGLALNGVPVTGIPGGNATVNPVRRAAYQLTATNLLGSTSGTVTVAAKGLDLLAGNLDGPGAIDGPAHSARFNSPAAVAADANGTIYIADYGNYTIRKVSGGLVSTLAGLPGQAGSADGTGAAARFSNPNGLATDASGNVYETSWAQHSIRKITPAGVVTTLAGQANLSGSADGSAANARFNFPGALTVDGAGNVFVADFYNYTIRKVTPAGVVSTLAGSPGLSGSADGTGAAARFSTPAGLALDAAGNLYLSDQGNFTLRKVTPAGVVSTLAGLAGSYGSADGTGAAARFYNPTGLALDRTSGNLYIADLGNDTIRMVTPAGVVSTVAGVAYGYGSTDGPAASARFLMPTGLALLPNGNLLIVDQGNDTLRTLDTTGTVTTTAGQPPLRGATDAAGALARFASPLALARNAAGDTFVADSQNNLIRKVSPAGVVTTLAGSGSYGSADGTGAAAQFNYPTALTLDAAGNLYVCDNQNVTIRKITPAGVVTTLAGSAGLAGSADGTGAAARFQQMFGIGADASGNLFVADSYNRTIRKITPAGVVTTLAGLAGSLGSVDGTGSAARFFQPMGIAVDAGGNVFVGDAKSIRKVTPAGVATTFVGDFNATGTYQDGTGSNAWFSGPTGLAFDAHGNLYACDPGNHAIRKITPAGVVTTPVGVGQLPGVVLGTFPGGLFSPWGLAISPAGDLLITTNNGIVQATLPD